MTLVAVRAAFTLPWSKRPDRGSCQPPEVPQAPRCMAVQASSCYDCEYWVRTDGASMPASPLRRLRGAKPETFSADSPGLLLGATSVSRQQSRLLKTPALHPANASTNITVTQSAEDPTLLRLTKVPEQRAWNAMRFQGNTSSSSISLALDTVLRHGAERRRIGLCAFGAGYHVRSGGADDEVGRGDPEARLNPGIASEPPRNLAGVGAGQELKSSSAGATWMSGLRHGQVVWGVEEMLPLQLSPLPTSKSERPG